MPNKIEIVFVHLGQSKSDHLIPNIRLTKQKFPEISINCVVSEDCQFIANFPDYVNLFIYKPTKSVDELFRLKTIDINFRKGFWRYSLERLIAINSVYIERPNSALLHIESDILLLPGFPLNKFEKLMNVYWLPVDKEKDAASLIFFPNLTSNIIFTNHLISIINDSSHPTDMILLNNLRQKFPDKYKLLPTFHPDFPKLNNFAFENLDRTNFNGIFDAASLGMWLTGIDPRINYGFIKYFATKSLIRSNFIVNSWSYPFFYIKNQGLYLMHGKKKVQIYNLHIHSKSKSLFSPNWDIKITQLIKLSTRGKTLIIFNPYVLAVLFWNNYLNRTLLEFIYNSPPLYFLRKVNACLKRLK